MSRAFSVVLLLALTSVAAGQLPPPALMVQGEGRSVPLGLSKLQVDVRIFGSIAKTTTTMTFTNPMPRVMEGDLYFPLPEGATISGYALDINGVMVDGAAVEKHEARKVFEDVVRRGVAPGLIEWSKGNNFKTRVFPIPALGSRTVRVQHLAELIGGKEGPAYHLPLNFKEKLNEFSLRIEVVKPGAQPKVAKGALANFAFARWQDNFVAETKLQDASLTTDLVVALPEVEKQRVLVEKADDGQVYFAVHDFPESVVPALAGGPPTDPAERAEARTTNVPKHVVLYWDASGSRGASDHKREIGLIKAYFKAQRRAAAEREQAIDVDLVLFRNAASKPKRIKVAQGDAGSLVKELEGVRYDGGTQMAVISPPPKSQRPDFYLLFTDGISNFGKEEPSGLDAPLYVFSADAAANHSFLQSLALTTGGRYFNLARLEDSEVLPAIGRAAWSFLSASADGKEATGLYPELPQPIQGRLTVVGKLVGNRAAVTLNYGVKGQTPQKRAFQVSRAAAADGSLLKRLWAQKKLADLVIFPKRNEKEITSLGKQFGMVTPFTSLIVLDSLEQYVEHEIAPPKSLAAMREEYMRRIDTIEHQRRKQKEDKLAEVVRMWEGRVQWWSTEFKAPKDFNYRIAEEKAGSRRALGTGAGRTAPAMAPTAREPGGPAPAAKPAGMPGVRLEAAPYPGMIAPSSPAPPAPPAPARQAARAADRAGEALAKDAPEADSRQQARQPGIVIKPWEPETPYLKDLKAAKGKDLFAVYLKHRPQYGNSPAFFLDCADFFREENSPELALQVLSNIAELQLEEPALLRVLGYRLSQLGYLDLAVETFQQVLDLRPEEPQSYRDLALTLARRAAQTARLTKPEPAEKEGKAGDDAVRADYARAIDLFIQVVLKRWDGRFAEIELIALEELNHIIPKARAAGVSDLPLDPRLIKLLDVDVRIVMTWHADATDIDLWVTEPSGEKAFYSHNHTTIGGLVSRDFTGGYGPEEYMVRRAMNGMYKIQANYYGSRATRLLGPVTVQVDVLTNYGRPNEEHKSLTLRLKEAKETVTIGEIEF